MHPESKQFIKCQSMSQFSSRLILLGLAPDARAEAAAAAISPHESVICCWYGRKFIFSLSASMHKIAHICSITSSVSSFMVILSNMSISFCRNGWWIP